MRVAHNSKIKIQNSTLRQSRIHVQLKPAGFRNFATDKIFKLIRKQMNNTKNNAGMNGNESNENVKNTENSASGGNNGCKAVEDDGTLACLNIPRDESNTSYNCEKVSQSTLVNMSFWVFGFVENVPTRFSKAKGKDGQMLVHIRMNKDDKESEGKKFFTGSPDILYVCKKLKEMGKLPRKVTMKGYGNKYWFE